MNVALMQSLGRLALEKKILKEVCACQYYDLRDKLSETSSSELIDIINQTCANCGRKGES